MCKDLAGVVEDNGYFVCVNCGEVISKALDTRNVTFGNSTMYLRPTYSRQGRFVNKVLASLNRSLSCEINVLLLNHLKDKKAKQPEDVLEGIRTWVTSVSRKPYIFASHYGITLGLTDVVMTPTDCRRIKAIFEETFFAHKRLRIKGPNFPFCELLHLICESFEMDPTTLFTIRYAKRLRCTQRTARYRSMWFDCLEYINEHSKLDLVAFKCKLLLE